MSIDGFGDIAGLVRRRAGIVLTEDKAYLLETRLGPVLQRFKLGSLGALAAELRRGAGEVMERAVVEAMTTHESSFFRDGKPFDHLMKILPRLVAQAGSAPVRIWSAACSTGQEPYSVAILASDVLGPQAASRVQIVATDVSAEILVRARAGIFSQFEVQRGLPVRALVKHFRQEGTRWHIGPAIAGMVKFEEHNLLGPRRNDGGFDVIFCRNVLIYFDAETKRRVLEFLSAHLRGDGVLYLGGAETVLGITDRLVAVAGERGAYGLAGKRAAA